MTGKMFVFALFAVASTLYAADPFEGTWKLSPSKTKMTQGAAPKEETAVIARQGDDLLVTITGTDASGKPISIKYSTPMNGGEGKILDAPYDAVSSKHIDSNTREVTYMKGGKEVRSTHGVIAKDGKSLRVTVKGTDADGKPIVGTIVFDKQPGT
jgi:hypothetical protein